VTGNALPQSVTIALGLGGQAGLVGAGSWEAGMYLTVLGDYDLGVYEALSGGLGYVVAGGPQIGFFRGGSSVLRGAFGETVVALPGLPALSVYNTFAPFKVVGFGFSGLPSVGGACETVGTGVKFGTSDASALALARVNRWFAQQLTNGMMRTTPPF
jgi:hypothetical protein